MEATTRAIIRVVKLVQHHHRTRKEQKIICQLLRFKQNHQGRRVSKLRREGKVLKLYPRISRSLYVERHNEQDDVPRIACVANWLDLCMHVIKSHLVVLQLYSPYYVLASIRQAENDHHVGSRHGHNTNVPGSAANVWSGRRASR